MSAIPYSIAKRISDKLAWPKKFYWSVFEVLIKANGLGFLVDAQKILGNPQEVLLNPEELNWKFKPETVETVLRHIVYRTIQFEKMFEFVRLKDVIDGMPFNAIPGCGRKATTKAVMGQLCRDNFLIKLKLVRNGKKIITPLYGLNLPLMLKVIDRLWTLQINTEEITKDEYEDRPTRKPSNLMLRGRCLLRCCLEFAENWQDGFCFLANYSEPISNVDEFIKEWAGHFLVWDDAKKDSAIWRIVEKESDRFEKDEAKCNKIAQLRKEYLKERNI